VSFFQWFLGISAGTTGLSGRLLCGGRVALEFLLLPMLIPLLPLLVNKSSWIEQLSGASLKKGQGLRGALGYMARPIVLAFIFLGVFAPLFRNLAVIEGVHVEFSQLPPVKLDASMDFNKFRFFASKYFDFTTFGDLENNRFILLPQFEVTKEMNQTLIKPFLGIYDERGQTIGFLKKEGLLDWGKLIAIAERGNPFFRSSYPFLASEMNSDKEFSEQAMNDLEELIIASLELSIRNVFRHVKMHGPFLGGYVDLRHTKRVFKEPSCSPVQLAKPSSLQVGKIKGKQGNVLAVVVDKEIWLYRISRVTQDGFLEKKIATIKLPKDFVRFDRTAEYFRYTNRLQQTRELVINATF